MFDLRKAINRVIGGKDDETLTKELLQERILRRDEEIARLERINTAADREIKRCAETHDRSWRFITRLAVFCLAVAGFFLGSTWLEAKRTISNVQSNAISAVEIEVGAMRTNFANQMDFARSNVSAQVAARMVEVHDETRKQIALLFQSSNILALVNSEAKIRIEEVADKMIETNVAERITPLREQTEKNAGELRGLIAEATTALKNLQEQSEFMNKVIMADHDDRRAYEWLGKVEGTRGLDAHNISLRIASSYGDPRAIPQRKWSELEDHFGDRVSWDIKGIQRGWRFTRDFFAPEYVKFVAGHTNLAVEQRLSFLRHVYLVDSKNSLHAAHLAAGEAAKQLNVKYRFPFFYNELESAWAAFSKTNRIFNAAKNTSNLTNEVFLSSDTNRVFVTASSDGKKLVLFRLFHVPKNRMVEGKSMNYTDHNITDMGVITTEKNLVAFHFAGWDSVNLKFDFRYEPDLSATDIVQELSADLINVP